MSDAPRINGNAYSFASLVIKLADERFTGIKSISYGDKLETEMVHGATRHAAPVGQTGGKYVPGSVKITMRKDSTKVLRASLAGRSSDGKSFGGVYFEIDVQYIEPDDSPHQDLLHRCRLVGCESSREEGAAALYDDLEITTQAIEYDGLTLYDQSRGTP
jgi:hypothetical protein